MLKIVLGSVIGVAVVFGAWCDIRGWRDERRRHAGANHPGMT